MNATAYLGETDTQTQRAENKVPETMSLHRALETQVFSLLEWRSNCLEFLRSVQSVVTGTYLYFLFVKQRVERWKEAM